MSTLQYDITALEKVTYLRLLSINETIRNNRNNITKDSLRYLKDKRKETDILLNKIKKLSINDIVIFHDLKTEYMSFEIKDPIFL